MIYIFMATPLNHPSICSETCDTRSIGCPRRLRANGPHAFDAVTAVGIAQAWKRPGTYLLEVTDPWG